MKKIILLGIVLIALSGCSVAMSASRSAAKGDLNLMQPGTERSIVENSFGPPDMTASLDNGKTKVIYKIDIDAHSAEARNAAVAGHLVADVLTLGLWEVVGTPLELAAQDKMTSYIIIYNDKNVIESVETIK